MCHLVFPVTVDPDPGRMLFFLSISLFFSYYLSAYLFHGRKIRAIVRIIASCLLTKIQTLSKPVYSKLSLMPVKI